jgi:tripartite-type tricarboxylate transporter receptor subunit TctC
MRAEKLRLLGLTLAFAAALPFAQASAQTVEEFYKKKGELDLMTGFGAGSQYDTWARIVAKHMGKHIPGNPTIVVKFMTGAGDLLLANHLTQKAERDGSVIGLISGATPVMALMGNEQLKDVDPRKFGYLGSAEVSDSACLMTAKSGIKSLEDMRSREIPVAGGGPTSAPSYMPPILNKMLGTKLKVIDGYKTSGDQFLALERGEVDGLCARLESMLRVQGEKFKSGEWKILFTINEGGSKLTPDIPSVFTYLKDPNDQKMLRFIRSQTALGRPFVTPPGLPADRLKALVDAYAATMSDPEFKADADKQKLDVTFVPGADLVKILNDLYATPKDLLESAAKLLPEGAS